MAAKKLEVIAPLDEPTITTRRWFAAPRELVYAAWTRPEHVKRWLGPRSATMTVCEIDLRVGGRYRWVFRSPDGHEAAFHGEFREIVPPRKLVSTFVFELVPDIEVIDTLTLEEKDGGTLATTYSVHPNMLSRDRHLAGGMEQGMSEGYAKLDEILVSKR